MLARARSAEKTRRDGKRKLLFPGNDQRRRKSRVRAVRIEAQGAMAVPAGDLSPVGVRGSCVGRNKF
jgi:hypothetical protein